MFSGPDELFCNLANQSPIMTWMFGADGRGTFFNDAWLAFTGRTLEQELDLGWTDSVHPEDMLKCADALILKFPQKQQFTMEHRLRRADGQYRSILTTCSPRLEGGELLGYAAWSVDVTECKAQPEERPESTTERRFELLNTATNDAGWEWDVENDCVWCNRQFFDVLGYDKIDVELWRNAIHPEDREQVLNDLMLAFAEKKAVWSFEYRFKRANGTYATVIDRAVIVYGEDGKPIHLTGGMRDVSVEREALKALKESEARNRTLIEQASDAIFLLDGSFNFIEVNSATCIMLGYAPEELLRLNIKDIISAEDLAGMPLVVGPVLQGKTVRLERNYRRKDGLDVPVENSVKQVVPGTFQVIARDISERKTAERALRESELRYRTLVETATEGIWMANKNDQTVLVNAKMAEIVGCSVDECLTLSWEKFIHPDDLPFVRSRLARRNTGVGEPFDIRLIRKNGEHLWVHVSSCAICDQSGQRAGQLAMVTNINERKRAEQKLRETAERLETIVNHAPLGIVAVDAKGNIIETNPAFQAMVGYSDEELRALSAFQLTHPEDREVSVHSLSEILSRQQHCYEFEKRYVRKDGSTIWVQVVVSTLQANTPEDVKMIGLVENITERKKILDELHRSEARFRALLDSDFVGISVGSADGSLHYANDEFLRIIGYSREDMDAGLTWRQLTAPGFENLQDRVRAELKERGAFGPFEKQYRRKDGSRVTVFMGGARYKADRSVVVVLDLTELKKAQREVNRLAHIVESTDDAVISVALDGTILTWNKGAERLYGYTASEIVGRSEEILIPNGRDEELEKAKAEAATGGSADHFEALRLTKTKEPKPVSITVSPLRDESGKIFGWSKIARDLTHLKRAEQLEEQFRQAQKLEAVGRLAGGVAHDFNNLLMIISSYTEMIHNKLAPDDKLRKKTREVLRASEKAADLTQQLLAFSRKQVLVPHIVDVNVIITEIVNMAKRLLGENIHITFNPGENLWPIQADSSQISQVLLNLLINARDAMPSGGFVTIETKNITVGAKPPAPTPKLSPGSYVTITVADTGIGMSEETKSRIFEPFFTTKENKGTGLGLATAYGIVKQSGGSIGVESAPEMGSSFHLYFPKTEETCHASVSSEKPRVQHQSGTILLVEDENALRSSVSEYLNELGYLVLEAETGKEAIHIAESYEGPIHLLLTDVVMPEMNGIEIAKKLAQRHELRTLYMSGYSNETIINQDLLRSGAAFIRKPFPLSTLAKTLTELMRDGQDRVM